MRNEANDANEEHDERENEHRLDPKELPMSGKQPSGQHPSEQQPSEEQHVRLCAYLFGELQGAERAVFEAELERSPALRAERERLLATIGLVQRAVPGEGLSPAVRSDVLASARRSRFRVLGGRGAARLVAAAVVLASAVLALRYGSGGGSSRTPEVLDGARTARAPEPDMFVQRGVENELRAKAPVASAAPEEASVPATMEAAKEKVADQVSTRLERKDNAPAQAEKTELSFDKDSLESLAYGGSIGADTPASSPALLAVQEPTNVSLPDFYGVQVPLDGFFLGHGEKKQGVELERFSSAAGQTKVSSSTGEVHLAGLSGGQTLKSGKYRGPGDSVPPGSAGSLRAAASGPGAAGTSTVASQPAPSHSPAFVRSAGREALEDLGYGGEDDEDAASTAQDRLGVRTQMTREQVVAEVEHLLGATRLAAGESPRDMFFRYWGDSPFVPALEEHTSTFGVDVDTASYTLTRAYLNNGTLPPREAVRTEEFLNYFKADQPPPTDGKPFAIGLELGPSLFASDARTEMLRVTVRGKDVADFERQPVALTFVIDNSGSMADGGRLELVKRSLGQLLRRLAPGDSVAVVKFSNSAARVAPMTPVTRRGELESLIQGLGIEGGTNVEAGLRLGYEVALENLQHRGVNRVILCSDGVGNIGETSAKDMAGLVKDARAKGIYLNTVGVGMGNHNDAFLEQLADQGDGICNYVDSDAEAKRVFVDGLASALQPIARDVKIQVEFDPAQVESWRLLGYENRALRTQDFRNDKIDAGEVNAGHQVTALYELVRLPSRSGPLATVRLRYKPPFAIDSGGEGERARAEAEQALELERSLSAATVLPGFASGSNGYQRAVLVAQFAEVLRQSVHARGDSLGRLLEESRRLEKALGDPDFTEFVALLGKANPLLDARTRQETPHVQQVLDELGKLHYEEALRERKRDLARQAGEPEPAAETRDEESAKARAAETRILELESAVREELMRANGIDPGEEPAQQDLKQMGYGGER